MRIREKVWEQVTEDIPVVPLRKTTTRRIAKK
jgi:hypothetical protein